MVYKILAKATNLPYTEELIWTVEGVHAVELSNLQPGEVIIYGDGAQLADNLSALPDLQIESVNSVETADWAEHWKQYWHVTPISERLTIVPSWESHTPTHQREVILTLDPGAAFGTGAHATTRLMLRAIDLLDQSKPFSELSVLDVGTGSGILAIAAAKLGSRMVCGQDIDPVVIPIAEDNAKCNQVDFIDWTDTPLENLCLTQYDVILANILAPVIIELLPELKRRLSVGGCLLLSGIINTAQASVESALARHSLSCQRVFTEDIWCCLQVQA